MILKLSTRSLVAVAIVAGLAATANAQPITTEDAPISFLVENRPLKKIEAGTLVNIEIHEDAACSAAVDTLDVPIDDFFTEVVKPNKVKGIDKLPDSVRLHYVLTPADASGRIFVRMTGEHIVPVGGDCQAQAALIQEIVVPASLSCGDGDVVKWDDIGSQWVCAPDDNSIETASCRVVAASLAGVAAPFSATATCALGEFVTGGGHSGIQAGDTVLTSHPDGANGWFCAVDQAAAAGTCEAVCCAVSSGP